MKVVWRMFSATCIAGLLLWWGLAQLSQPPLMGDSTKPSPGEESSGPSKFSALLEVLSKARNASRLQIGRSRTWTDTSGRNLEGVLVSASTEEVLLRVMPQQRVYRLPINKLSDADRRYLSRANPASSSTDLFPPLVNRWPPAYNGFNQRLAVTKSSAHGGSWKTANYEIVPVGKVDPKMIRSLAGICESIDGVIRRTPLPLRWGRPQTETSVIHLYEKDSAYLRAGGVETFAGHYDIRTNEVHIRVSALLEADTPIITGDFSLKKRKQYDLLVHELLHQAGSGLMNAPGPAWVKEGLAELYSAAQNTPGNFEFRDTRASVKRHISSELRADGIVQFRALRLEHLEPYWNRSLGQFNRVTAKDADSGFFNYSLALILVEHFTMGESNAMRPYLEAVMTNADPVEASKLFLLRGRSFEEVEHAISERWAQRGLKILFRDTPQFHPSDLEGGIGTGSSLSRIRRNP